MLESDGFVNPWEVNVPPILRIAITFHEITFILFLFIV